MIRYILTKITRVQEFSLILNCMVLKIFNISPFISNIHLQTANYLLNKVDILVLYFNYRELGLHDNTIALVYTYIQSE